MPQRELSRITARVTIIMTVLLALAVPIGYFIISYEFIMGSLETEAEINARLVSSIINSNPLLWKFEQVRLEELLSRRPTSGFAENRRVFDSSGALVAESLGDTPKPLLRCSHDLLDSGAPVGKIEISRSLRPLIGKTLIAAIFGVMISLLLFRFLPYRAIIKAQKKLQDANSFLNTVMESSTNAVIVVDLSGTILMANRRCQELTGYSDDDLSRRRFLNLFQGDARDQVAAEIARISSGEAATVTFETAIPVRHGDTIVISCGIAPFCQENKPAGLVISAEDITDRKESEQQLKSFANELEQTNAELRSFAYIISHDLRAPLVNIKGFAGELRYGIETLYSSFKAHCNVLEEGERGRIAGVFEEDIPEALDFINDSVARMDRLINAVLKLSRMGHLELKPEPVRLRELVDSILRSMSHQIEARNTKVAIGALPEIVADRIALEQILGNLLDNAVKYLDPRRSGELEIYSESDASAVTIHIRDNGRGIALDDQGRIFEIFRRAGRQDVRGDGMGLTYVRTLVRKLHGRIWCQSEPDAGSTFSFTIPLAAPHHPAPVAEGHYV